MNIKFLDENPFYVLDVLPTDKRSTISSNADEKAFFFDSNVCSEAQASLLNPSKRLAAEIDWFCGSDAATISDIRSSIENHEPINTLSLTGLARLNAMLFNFAISSFDCSSDIGYAVLDIDEEYNDIDVSELAGIINECHTKAGLLPASDDEIERGLNKKREQIRHLISEKTSALSEDEYIEFATMLAEECASNADYADGVIINDVIDQYELKMQSSIEASSSDIITQIDRIKRISNEQGIEENLTILIKRIKKWDRLVQPLQLKSMASGVAHQTSERIGYAVRNLSLWLHNEKGMTKQALILSDSMQDVFAEIRDLAEKFDDDTVVLNNILDENEEQKQIIAEIKAVEQIIAKWKGPNENKNPNAPATNAITKSGVDDLITRIKTINARLIATNLSNDLVIQVRKVFCMTVRDGAIYAHNERHQTALALEIAKVLYSEFFDISELSDTLSKDVVTLDREMSSAATMRSSQTDRSISGFVVAMAVIAIIILIGLVSNNGSPSNSNTYEEPPTYYQPEAKIDFEAIDEFEDESSKLPVIRVAQEEFSSSTSVGTIAYADIVSIFPAIGIYQEGEIYYTDFVCECRTSIGTTVWVYMSTSEYIENFDANVSTNIVRSEAEEILFPSPKRVRGITMRADNIIYGLSDDTGAETLIGFTSVD